VSKDPRHLPTPTKAERFPPVRKWFRGIDAAAANPIDATKVVKVKERK
jgi:hypothetical protein